MQRQRKAVTGRAQRSTGVIGGGIAAAVCCSVAIAVAETFGDYDIRAVPGTQEVTGFYGITVAGPASPESIQATQQFDVYDTHGNKIGSFDALTSQVYTPDRTNEEIFVSQVLSGTPGTGPENVPQVGSVFDIAHAGSKSAQNVYYDLVATTPDGKNVISDVGSSAWLGHWPFNRIIPPFDASAHIDAHTNSEVPLPLPNGNTIVADPDSPETWTGVTSLPPWAVGVQGQQLFDVVNPDGDVVGKFTADVLTTEDFFTGHSLDVFVTSDAPGSTVGTGKDDVPPVGSAFNILYLFTPHAYTMYSDYAPTTPGGDDQVSLFWDLFGLKFTTHPSFDAVHGFTDGTPLFDSLPYHDGLKIVPVGTETYFGINGVPNGIQAGGTTTVQGYQVFDIVNSKGDVVSSFQADETTYGDASGTTAEALLVTRDGTTGTTPGDAPPVGSWIEYTHNWLFSTLYVDIAGKPDAVTDTLITPLGNIDLSTSVNAALGLLGLDFFAPAIG